MKIAVLTTSVTRSAGGLLDATRDLYLNVKNADVEITVFSFEEANMEEDLASWSPINIKLFKKTNPFYYSAELRDAIINYKADILHVHGLWRYHHAFISTWKKATKKPVIVSPHGMLDPYIIKNQGFIKRVLGNILFANKSFKNIDYFHALSDTEVRDIKNYGLNQPIVKIPNGINLPTSNIEPQQESDKKHLLFLGRLHPKKGVDLLLQAIGELNKDQPNFFNKWHLDIVGWPQEGFDKRLEAMANKFGIENLITFHGGLFGEEKQNAYKNASAYILPSHGEGLPMTVLEAWAYKLPVIITPFCNLPEGYETNAAIKIENNVESIKAGLLKLTQLPNKELTTMGLNGRELVEDKFSWKKSAESLVETYQLMMSSLN